MPADDSAPEFPNQSNDMNEIDQLRAQLTAANAENARLRDGLSKVATNIGNGSVALPSCSLEFLCDSVPGEVKLQCEDYRRQLTAATQRAEKAEGEVRELRKTVPVVDEAKVPKEPGFDYVCWICKGHKNGLPAYTSKAVNEMRFDYCQECWNKPMSSGLAGEALHKINLLSESNTNLRAAKEKAEHDLDAARRELVAHREKAQGNYWAWQGNGEDNLESLVGGCPVLISAAVLRDIVVARDGAEQELRHICENLCGCKVAGEVTLDMVYHFVEGEIEKQYDLRVKAEAAKAKAEAACAAFRDLLERISFSKHPKYVNCEVAWQEIAGECAMLLSQHDCGQGYVKDGISKSELVKILGENTEWPLRDVIDQLVLAVNHLRHDHDCDHHRHEAYQWAVELAKKYIIELARLQKLMEAK